HRQMLTVGVDNEGIARGQKLRVVVDYRLRVEQGLRRPIIPAPVQEPCESVPKIEPLQEPDLDQGEVHQAVEIPLLWIETGVEPDGPAAPDALVDERHPVDRKSTRLNSSHLVISYAVFCLKKKK